MLDTDEVLYLKPRKAENDEDEEKDEEKDEEDELDGTGIGSLPGFLDTLESSSPRTCAIKIPWYMTYGEHRFLQPHELMLDAWKRLLHRTSHKSIFRPEFIASLTENEEGNLPHGVECKKGTWNNGTEDDEWKNPMGDKFEVTLFHYYQKSVEEWIVKLEQSMEPYVRFFHQSYDGHGGSKRKRLCMVRGIWT